MDTYGQGSANSKSQSNSGNSESLSQILFLTMGGFGGWFLFSFEVNVIGITSAILGAMISVYSFRKTNINTNFLSELTSSFGLICAFPSTTVGALLIAFRVFVHRFEKK